ncbi:MAG: trypsin-like peptidase domain-containing protein [Crocinitomicaceae bacterium]|nr:trypsin-like peptidase domain-containing protein [Crocinitomicaceae bacterium]
MKKLFYTLIFLQPLLFFAQEKPYGYNMSEEELNRIGMMELERYDIDKLVAEAEADDKMGYMAMFGKILDQHVDPTSAGTWSEIEDGGRLWQLRFRTLGAKAVSVFFDHFFLPEGATLYIYSADREWFEGPYTFEDNKSHGRFRTAEVFGDEAILEYREPAGVIGSPQLGIRGFGLFYRFINDLRPSHIVRGGSDPCEVDVNCPEGNTWSQQRNSVVHLGLVADGGVGLCTGTMVNNTSYNCKNYILTAMHCTLGMSANDLLDTQIRFNYQRSGCGTGSAPTTQSRVGAYLRADSNDNGGQSGSDFALLEMEDAIPTNWNVFYAGWNASTSVPASSGGIRVVGIHHPSGDVKKISTSNSVTSATWGAANNHWRVVWKQTVTNWGVTEPGSSGSPIFDINHRIVGTLTGGGSFCNTPTEADYYGKFDKHWNGNPNPSNEDLQDWLDAAGTGLTAINGSFKGSGATPCLATGVEETLAFTDVQLYPSVADNEVNIFSDRFNEIKEVRIFSSTGQLIATHKLFGSSTILDVSAYSNGFYFVTFIQENGGHLTKKMTVTHQ